MVVGEKRHWVTVHSERSLLNMACKVRFMSFNIESTLNSSRCALSGRQSQPFFTLKCPVAADQYCVALWCSITDDLCTFYSAAVGNMQDNLLKSVVILMLQENLYYFFKKCIYTFDRCFYPKWLTLLSAHVPLRIKHHELDVVSAMVYSRGIQLMFQVIFFFQTGSRKHVFENNK